MDHKLTPFFSVAWRGIVVLLTLEVVAVSAMRYFTHSETPPELITSNAYAHPFLIIHVAGGVTALLLGPLQFVRRIRQRFPLLHRTSGRIYAAAVLVGAPAGFMLALGTLAGPVAAVGFAIPAVLWLIFTYLGIKAAMERRIEHRDWMLRSYAITSNAITLRLMLPFAGLVLHIPFPAAYPVIAWLSWIANLALFELYIRHNRLSPVHEPRLATA